MGLIAYDPTLNAMNFAASHGAPYLCMTGGVFEFGVDAIPGLIAGRRAPVVIASHWFAGAVAMATLDLAERFHKVDVIDIGIVIDRGKTPGAAGPAVIADFDRISANSRSTLMRKSGRYVWVPNEEAGRKVQASRWGRAGRRRVRVLRRTQYRCRYRG